MAEFKLGRIRFVWKDSWSTATTYYKDDVIRFGGKIYICVEGHTSAVGFFTDLEIVPSKWNLVSDGQTWKSTWATATSYVYGDIVQYGARLYIATAVHTSQATDAAGLEADIANWDVFAEGLNWKSDWAVATRYIVNDVVKYGGTTYVCNTYHTSNATESNGLEADQAKWDTLNQGIEFKSTWVDGIRYKINDVVQYGAALWIVTTAHTSSALFSTDVANWTEFVRGFQFESDWEPLRVYQPGDIVSYGGNQYIALLNHSEKNPFTETAEWQLYTQGIKFLGDWGDDSTLQDYRAGEVVRHGGYTYICTADNQNQEPPNASYWERLNSGLRWRGTWVDDQEYLLGDVARYGDNSYICVQQHWSEGDDFSTIQVVAGGGGAENSRPDLDITGAYWNIIAVGNETSVLTTKGDLVYYSGAGPARLPVGAEGQVLRVSEADIPEWAYLGVADDVYHVATHGADVAAPTNGRTLDKAWKSIRYAAEQIEKGTKVPEARKLLELNRQFIQREIVEWTDAQITGVIAPFSGGMDYDSAKCERDMGFIIDAAIWDITHGGNVKTREAALSYVTSPGQFYVLGQEGETVASINYGLTVIASVLAQTAPAANYQTLNGDNSTAVASQYFDATLTAEATVLTEVQTLVKIVTDAITAGVATNIPGRIIRNTLIKVSTGKYQEVLPIIVPAECCIIGDELRSVSVSPRRSTGTTASKISRNSFTYQLDGNLTPKKDAKYSLAAYDRIGAIIGDIVEGVTVTPTTGNTETQSALYPLANSDKGHERKAVNQLARLIKRNIDHGLGDKVEAYDTLPLADTMGTPADGYARNLLHANRDFIKSEMIGWIADNYPNLKYSRTKCRQDTGYILDSVLYDITFGGNWQSVNAGEAYFVGAVQDSPAASERAATIASYAFLKGIMQTIARNITVTPLYGIETQIAGTAGGAGQATTVGNLLDDVIDIVTNGSGSVAVTYPSITGASAGLQSDFADVATQKSAISDSVIDFINTNFGTYKYNGALCRRDSGYLVDASYYDSAFNSNYWAVQNGISYLRAQSAFVLSDQLQQEIGAIKYIKAQAATSLTSSATAVTRSNAAYDEILDILNNGLGNADALSFTDTGTANFTNARTQLQTNRAFIVSEISSWLSSNYNAVWVALGAAGQATCQRDIGYAIDAFSYDINYGGNIATRNQARSLFNNITGNSVYPNADQKTASAAMYTQLGVVCSGVVQETYAGADQSGTAASATEGTRLTTLTGNVNAVIVADSISGLVTEVAPSITWAATGIKTAVAQLATDRTAIIKGTLQFITDTYSGFVYNHAKCSRDIGYILDAASYDFCLGTTFASMVASYSYLRRPSIKVIGNQKGATIAANEYARTLARVVTSEATAIAQIDNTMQLVNDIIFGGASEGANAASPDFDVYSAIRQLELNKEFIASEAVAYVNDYFADVVTATTAATSLLTVTSTAWLSQNMDIKFTATAIGGLSTTTTYYVKDIVSATTFTISATIGGAAVTVTDATGTMGVQMAYVYNEVLCKRDVRTVVDAMKWDLTYPQQYVREYTESVTVTLPSNYKSKYCARYYINSVLGSQEEDFYYLRNGTGLRLQTMEGLYGDIGPENATGTSRPTGGAYASLDPGWGPEDKSVWITARSPYVQNCTTFGYGAIGQKIDGALHNGGNDSMVSNDFTQVISDGIGAWLLNNGRAEMVSVFTYYSHIGYLCETGGRARATNGNNSYGDFGSVAEGVDPDEVAVTAIIDNKFQYNATVGGTNTDQSGILNIEFTHAGNDYTEAQIDIFGAGSDEALVADEFRDGAIIQARVVDDQVAGDAGGSSYLVVSNTAQTGAAANITLAATDGNLDTAYPGMKIVIDGGAGIGQYALIDTYSSGTKIATVIKESDGSAGWDHFVPGTTFVTPNSSSTYTIEPALSFTAPAKSATNHSITSNTYNALEWVVTTEEFTAVAGTTASDGTGATFDINRMGSKYYVSLNAAGTGYTRLDAITILGTSLGGATPANDMTITLTTITSGAVVDFDFTGIGTGGKFIAVPNNTAGRYSIDGASWTSTTFPSAGSGNWTALANGLQNDGSSVYKPNRILAVCAGSSNVAKSTDGITWTAATALPVALNTASGGDIAFGYVSSGVNRFVVISESDRDVAYTEDEGQNWTLTTDSLPATGFTAITYGKGLYVAVQGGGSTVAASSADGITWVSRTLPSSASWVDVVWGNGRFIAIADDQTAAAYSLDGITWTALTVGLASGNPKRIAYGHGMFAVTSTDTDAICYSEYGVTAWANQVVTAATGGYNGIAFGNPNRVGEFVAIGTGAATNVANCVLGARTRGRPSIASEKIFAVKLAEPGSTYASAPTLTVTDPNNVDDVVITVRLGDGALGNPTFNNRGTGFATATAEVNPINSNGNADFFQNGTFIAVRQLTERPVAGSNITFDSLPNQYFKLVNTITFLGSNDGSYTTFLQVSPAMGIGDAPPHADPVQMRIRFSQVRLTGHDFLDIGTGNFVDTNYPGTPVNLPAQAQETLDADGGRVFFTATDQDGNFRVGDLFSIEQATGVATLNADAFNIAGLQELTLGEVTLGGNSASVAEFSTDPFFTANSDSVVPTQRAIKAYIEAQIGGGGATLNVNSITAGDILISNNVITTASGELINITANINFTGSITGLPVAYNYFLR